LLTLLVVMKMAFSTWFLGIMLLLLSNSVCARNINVSFVGKNYSWTIDESISIPFGHKLSDEAISIFYQQISASPYQGLIDSMLMLKETKQLNDWLFYQLVRSTAQQLSPKSENYYRYTLYKWFLLNACGYEATLSIKSNCLLFYVKSNENIYGMPFFVRDEKQFICINYHDYGKVNFNKKKPVEITTRIPTKGENFSYKVTQMPELSTSEYVCKELQFNYKDKVYHFSIKLDPQVKNLFKNYPVADFETYFNIPLSKETYSSLIPDLKQNVSELNEADGIDYLMRFTRNSFLYETDQAQFGKERRLTPEQTLLYDYSDCDDRAGLFFYLVKEIYNKPMIVLLYPTHVTIAIQLDNPIGNPILFDGKSYTICDPTPQVNDLKLGQVANHLQSKPYEVVYVYTPHK
jgi:hypothetical protein